MIDNKVDTKTNGNKKQPDTKEKFFKDDDDVDIQWQQLSRSSDTSGRISTATTLPVADKNKNEHIFGSEVSLRSDTD